MRQNKFHELVFSSPDIFDFLMQGRDLKDLDGIVVDHTVDFSQVREFLDQKPVCRLETNNDQDVDQYHQRQQANWHMPQEFQDIDIASHILDLCQTQEELQRAGKELLLFQERNLFDLLKYLHYLVSVMKENNIIWGLGRGSSVASFVLYLLGVHRINSIYYELDIEEFLR